MFSVKVDTWYYIYMHIYMCVYMHIHMHMHIFSNIASHGIHMLLSDGNNS